MLELIIGIAIGIIIGLTPGLHPNTIIPALILIAPLMTPLGYATLLVSLLITTNYFEFVKTTYLSAPDEGNALSMKYAQKLLLNGRGAEAVKLLSIGALGTILITAIIAPTIIEIIPIIEKTIKNYIGVVLIGISLHLILKEKRNIGKATKIYLLAGILGMLTLRSEILNQPLLPLLSGMYGLSNIIKNIKTNTNIPRQMNKIITEIERKTIIKGITKAVMSSSIITVIPAIGPSQASLISNELVKTKNEQEKLITLGGVNTGDAIFSLTALIAINKARSGIIEQITSITRNEYLILILAAIISGIISYILVNKTANKISKIINKTNYTKVNITLSAIIISIVGIIDGWIGLIVLLTATIIGLKSNSYLINQNHLMAALIVPTIIYYL